MAPNTEAGPAVFRVQNAGEVVHHLVLVILPRDLPGTLSGQLRAPRSRAFPTLAFLPGIQPGSSGTFAVQLAPGRYGLICDVKDPDGKTHREKGMVFEFQSRK